MKHTCLLIVLDGWGLGEAGPYNAISQANTPHWDRLWQACPHRQLVAAAQAVGLPDGQMGNSEVGHLHLGAGRIVLQTLMRINQAIADDSFYQLPQLTKAITAVDDNTLHIIGLLSDGGVHSHQQHLFALCRAAAAQGVKRLSCHAILDGRDAAPGQGLASLKALQQVLDEIGIGVLSSVCGRYYAMDRDRRWQRTQQAYDLLVNEPSPRMAANAEAAWQMAVDAGESDEFIKPIFIEGGIKISAKDSLICSNFRTDRMRQLTAALAAKEFTEFNRPFVLTADQLITMTAYDEALPLPHLFAKQDLHNCFGEVLAAAAKTQLRLAETEKFAHVTYFFNGGREQPHEGEDRKLIPSPKVATYDLAPAMKAGEITDELIKALHSYHYDFILCNYANGDMVGHTGSMEAAIAAVQVLDECLGRLAAAMTATQAQALITADHGNCEQMMMNGAPWTAHTMNPVPILYYGPRSVTFDSQPGGLADVAPTLLKLMNLKQPAEMSGRSLL